MRWGSAWSAAAAPTCGSSPADVGAALGCGAHLTRLRRTAIGPFEVGEARAPDDRGEPLPLARAVAHLPRWARRRGGEGGRPRPDARAVRARWTVRGAGPFGQGARRLRGRGEILRAMSQENVAYAAQTPGRISGCGPRVTGVRSAHVRVSPARRPGRGRGPRRADEAPKARLWPAANVAVQRRASR